MRNSLHCYIALLVQYCNMSFFQFYFTCLVTALLVIFDLGQTEKAPPVILIPGYGGSQLEAKLNKQSVKHDVCYKNTDDFFRIWVDVKLLTPVVIDCWADSMRLVYNNETRNTSDSPGVTIRVSNFGDPFQVEYVDPSSKMTNLKALADELVAIGYERNVSLRGAPYDWRKSAHDNEQWFVDFQSLIQETYSINEKTPVLLVAHSMGSKMCLHFLQKMTQSWKDTHIAAFISLGGPFGGSVKTMKAFATGENWGIPIIDKSAIHLVETTSSSLAFLLPSTLFWKPDETLVFTDSKNYSLSNLKEYFKSVQFPEGYEMWKDSNPDILNFTAPGVEVHCLYGIGVQTIESLSYAKDKFPNDPTMVYGDGDGTVNLRSLEACMNWKTKQTQKVYKQTFPNIDHKGIKNDRDVINYILALIDEI